MVFVVNAIALTADRLPAASSTIAYALYAVEADNPVTLIALADAAAVPLPLAADAPCALTVAALGAASAAA